MFLVVSPLFDTEHNALIGSLSGATLESLEATEGCDWIVAQLLNCVDGGDSSPIEVEKDRGIWMYVGFPSVSENPDGGRVVDFSDGALRRPTERELFGFAFGPPVEDVVEPQEAK